MTAMTPTKRPDGFFHPEGEREIVALVRWARESEPRLTVRVRGSGHAPAHAIYTDPLGDLANRIIHPGPPDCDHGRGRVGPPPEEGPHVNVILDVDPMYQVLSEEERLIEVDAGMQMSTLLRKLSKCHGWTLAGTGGIAHQTIGGFTATGSAGGSLTYSINDSIAGFRLVDGTGTARDVDAGHPDFGAMVPNLGLLGIVSRVRLRCVEDFAVVGREDTRKPEDSAIDLRCPSTDARSLRTFLENPENEYARVVWWPQRDAERVIVWTAKRCTPGDDCGDDFPVAYKLFGRLEARLAMAVIGVTYTFLGTLGEPERLIKGLKEILDHVDGRALLPKVIEVLRGFEGAGPLVAILNKARRRSVRHAVESSGEELAELSFVLPILFPPLLDWFVPPDSTDRPAQEFADYAWSSLPMDNVVDDVYMPVAFTEMWLPMGCIDDVMDLLHAHFRVGEQGDAGGAYDCTGTFAFELYAAKRTDFWLNAAHSGGGPDDPWADGAFRFNPYWYGRNVADPTEEFFPQIWKLLDEKKIPYRLHWGKFMPRASKDGVRRLSAQYPCWQTFLDLRAQYDPDGIFLNQYWRHQLGLGG